MKTSVGKPLAGVEWTYEGTISIFKGTGYQGGVSRTLFLNPKLDELGEIPEELFMVKISQSKNPELAGKPLFRFFSFRANEDEKFSSLVPKGVDQNTPLKEIKDMVVERLQSIETAQTSIAVPLHGKFTIVNLKDGNFTIYDEEKFPSSNLDELGEPDYFLKNDVPMKVKLKGAENLGNEYFQSRISSDLTADEVFQKKASGQIWGEDADVGEDEPEGEIW